MRTPSIPGCTRRAVLAALGALCGPAQARDPGERRLTVGIEAALLRAGLAERLARDFGRDTGLQIVWQAGPSGALMTPLERGELVAALCCAPERERLLEARNLVHARRPVLRSEVLLVGPPPRRATPKTPASGDPAGVAGLGDAAAALARIAEAGARGAAGFVAESEADAVHSVANALWAAGGLRPEGAWLQRAGAGPAAVLEAARASGSYALVERGVWSALGGGKTLAVLVQGDPRLALTYHVMLSFRSSHAGSRLMLDWLAGRPGQAAVARHGHGYRRA